ncbi:MAG TPA: caspase family protein [Steroidobacteraceae bacterium]|nr:caspase family protein [Steroidobacteraceae bacterium]
MRAKRHTLPFRAHRVWMTALLMLVAAAPAAAAHRLALVIGNDSYEHAQPLRNARADARAIAAVLQSLGYAVTLKQDVNLQQMKQSLRAFKAQVAGGDEVVFYFSGHGVQFGGTNYLIPVDLVPQNEEQVADDSVGLQRVLDDLSEQKARFSLAIIDACRDNPFKGTGRAIGKRGLAPVTAATGEMVLYSAGAGQEALDRLGGQDNDPNGLFTRVLIKEIKKPGVPANQVLKNVSYQVVQLAKSVNHDQVPALYDQTIGDYYFMPGGHTAPPLVAPPVQSATAGTLHVQTADELEQSYWNRIHDSTDPQDFSDYKKQFPQGAHAGEANLELRRLKRAAAPKSTPVARSAEVAPDAAAPPAAIPAAATSAGSSGAGPATVVHAGTYQGFTTSTLAPGVVSRGRMVIASNGDFEYTGETGVKVRGTLNLSHPQQIEGAGTVSQPKRFGIPLARYPDGSSTANMVIRGEVVNGKLRGHYSDAYETGDLIFDLNNPM